MKVKGLIVSWMDVQMRCICLLSSQLCFASYTADKEEKNNVLLFLHSTVIFCCIRECAFQ